MSTYKALSMKKSKLKHILLALLFYIALVSFIVLSYPGRDNFRIEAVFGYTNILAKGYINTIIIKFNRFGFKSYFWVCFISTIKL